MINIENTSHYLAWPVLSSTPPQHHRDEARRAGRTRQRRPRHLRQTPRHGSRTTILAATIALVIPAMSTAEPSAISPKLAGLIVDYQRSAAAFEAIDQDLDPGASEEAGMLACRGLKAPLYERPVTVAEFTARFEALIKGTGNDNEFYIPRTLAADIRALIGEDVR